MEQLWQLDPSSGTANFIAPRYRKLGLPLAPVKLSILRSSTVEPIVPLLRTAAFCSSMDLEVELGEFNAYQQEIFDPESALYQRSPDVVLLIPQASNYAPELCQRYADLSEAKVAEVVQRAQEQLASLIASFRQHSQAHFIVHNLEVPTHPATGLLDAQRSGQVEAIAQINRALCETAQRHSGVYVLDYDALIARHGRTDWRDERKWLTTRMAVSSANLVHLAREWVRFLVPLVGRVAKCAVVDLDNTMWGGVIGEDGMDGIALSPEYPGAAFQEMQRALLDLRARGILLAICSKNNEADAMEALAKHPGMLLRPEHFAAMRINWQPKSQNLVEIAQELNIGIDSLAFLDDNPIERQQVRSLAPEVMVVELPESPFGYAEAVRTFPAFGRLTASSEDQQRSKYYAAAKEAKKLETSVGSREDFFRSLEQRAIVQSMTSMTQARIAQLIGKTNQFNLTTRRRSEPEVVACAAEEGYHVAAITVVDRFVDNGIVGVAIAHTTEGVCEIDTFLLSCRVIARTVETAFLSYLVAHARDQGATHLQGWFLTSKKNAPAANFYQDHGFRRIEESDEGALWSLDLGKQDVACPEWIALSIDEGDE